jgi:hypothetical protein
LDTGGVDFNITAEAADVFKIGADGRDAQAITIAAHKYPPMAMSAKALPSAPLRA